MQLALGSEAVRQAAAEAAVRAAAAAAREKAHASAVEARRHKVQYHHMTPIATAEHPTRLVRTTTHGSVLLGVARISASAPFHQLF